MKTQARLHSIPNVDSDSVPAAPDNSFVPKSDHFPAGAMLTVAGDAPDSNTRLHSSPHQELSGWHPRSGPKTI